MKHIHLTALFCLGMAALAQEVQFDDARSADFGAVKTGQPVDCRGGPVGGQFRDQVIRRAVDPQPDGQGLRRVESGGDVLAGNQAEVSPEKGPVLLTGLGGPGSWRGPWNDWGRTQISSSTQVTSSTIDVGRLVIGLFKKAAKQHLQL